MRHFLFVSGKKSKTENIDGIYFDGSVNKAELIWKPLKRFRVNVGLSPFDWEDYCLHRIIIFLYVYRLPLENDVKILFLFFTIRVKNEERKEK